MPESDWRTRALAAIDATIADWEARPEGAHSPRTCPLCREFRGRGCPRCPVILYDGRSCEDEPEHQAWQIAYVAHDIGRMRTALTFMLMRVRAMRAAVSEGRVKSG